MSVRVKDSSGGLQKHASLKSHSERTERQGVTIEERDSNWKPKINTFSIGVVFHYVASPTSCGLSRINNC